FKIIGNQKRWDQNEARYMEVVRSCRYPSETMRDMSNMLGIITMALTECPKDFIGPIFMEVAANSQAGQFFTLPSISEMLARMTLENARETLYRAYYEQGRTRLELMEPTCGVGGMVLAANQVLREKGFDLAEEIHWTCVDIDWRAICGAFIQLELTGVPATMVHGNALTLEEWASWPTSTLVLQHCNSLHQGGLSLPSARVQGGKAA